MARIKLAYIGGGSTRAPGTMASFAHQGDNFDGSEVVLIDLNEERLALAKEIAQRLMSARGLDITVEATTDRLAGLDACDAVPTSYRPGGFEARVLDERIPLSHNVIGQETQGPGGFFVALRSITAMQDILEDISKACPDAAIFNYTNPVNIVSRAVSDNSDANIVSLCKTDRLPPHASRSRGAGSRQARRGQRRPQPRIVVGQAHLRLRAVDPAAA